MERVVVSGKRKRAIARAIASSGNGQITINRKNYEHLHLFDRLRISEPVRIAHDVLGEANFNIKVDVMGGGEKGPIEAARLAIARAIVKITKSLQLKKSYMQYDKSLLVADIRRKETYKPGDSKARKKRQKSYR